MTLSTVRRTALSAAVVLTVATALAACSGSGATHAPDLTADSLKTCPAVGIATSIGADFTSSTFSEATKSSHMAVIANHVNRTALCSGRVYVFAFASSIGATVTIFDGELHVDAPTDNARIRKAEKLAAQTIATITSNYDSALSSVSGAGTDALGMLTLLQQANEQFPDLEADNVLLTDGQTNIGIDPTSVPDAEAARALADEQAVPDLSGASLKIIGIGKQASGELPSTVIANLTAFWEQICQNTNATSCTVSTEGR